MSPESEISQTLRMTCYEKPRDDEHTWRERTARTPLGPKDDVQAKNSGSGLSGTVD